MVASRHAKGCACRGCRRRTRHRKVGQSWSLQRFGLILLAGVSVAMALGVGIP